MIRPIYDQIVILPSERKAEKAPEGAIDGFSTTMSEGKHGAQIHIVQDKAAERAPITEGLVISVGPGKLLESGFLSPLPFEPGDRVVFTKHGGHEKVIEGVRFIIIHADEAIGILDNVSVVEAVEAALGFNPWNPWSKDNPHAPAEDANQEAQAV
jgi:chaperonin GroES